MTWGVPHERQGASAPVAIGAFGRIHVPDPERADHEFVHVKPPPALALPAVTDDMCGGRLAVDVPLANRVRSGRKQP
jgi:hypothetical protein